MTLAAFGMFRAGETRRWRQLLPCTAAVALGVLLGGIQLLPTADVAAHSTRTGLSREFALTFSHAPVQPVPAVVAVFLRERRLQRERLHVVSRIRHLLGRHPAGRARSGCGSDVTRCRERRALIAAVTVFARGDPDPRAGALRRNRGRCSRISRCSNRFAPPFDTSFWCSSRSRSWPPSRSTTCWRSRTAERRARRSDGRPLDSGSARHRHDARAEHAAPALRHGTRSRARRPRPPGVAIVAAVTLLVVPGRGAGSAGRSPRWSSSRRRISARGASGSSIANRRGRFRS